MGKNKPVLTLEEEVKVLRKENRLLDAKVLEIYTLYNISKRLSVTTHLEEIFSGAIDIISRSLSIDDFCILLLDENKKVLTTAGLQSDSELKDVEFKLGEGVCGRVAVSGELAIIPDVSKVPDFLYYKGRKNDIGSFLSIPLKDSSGVVLGVLNVHKFEIDSFSDKDVDFFAEVAGQVAVAIDKAISFKNVKELSIRDDMTGLYNRRYFFDFFEREMLRAKRYEKNVALIMVDVDHFKNFNDQNGHILGDTALKMVASQLTKHLRQSDVIARLGGEEFIIALAETPKADAVNVANKLRKAIELEPVKGEESQPGGKLTATFGVSAYPEDAEFATELIECADQAMYLGKGTSRNIVIPYEPQ